MLEGMFSEKQLSPGRGCFTLLRLSNDSHILPDDPQLPITGHPRHPRNTTLDDFYIRNSFQVST